MAERNSRRLSRANQRSTTTSQVTVTKPHNVLRGKTAKGVTTYHVARGA